MFTKHHKKSMLIRVSGLVWLWFLAVIDKNLEVSIRINLDLSIQIQLF